MVTTPLWGVLFLLLLSGDHVLGVHRNVVSGVTTKALSDSLVHVRRSSSSPLGSGLSDTLVSLLSPVENDPLVVRGHPDGDDALDVLLDMVLARRGGSWAPAADRSAGEEFDSDVLAEWDWLDDKIAAGRKLAHEKIEKARAYSKRKIEQGRQIVSDVTDSVGDTIDSVTDSVGDTYDAAKEKIASIRDSANEAVDKYVASLREVAGIIGKKLPDGWPTVRAIIFGFFNGFFVGLGDVFHEVLTAPECEGLASDVTVSAEEMMAKVCEAIVGLFSKDIRGERSRRDMFLEAIKSVWTFIKALFNMCWNCEPLRTTVLVLVAVLAVAVVLTGLLVASGYGVLVKIAGVILNVVFGIDFVWKTVRKMATAIHSCATVYCGTEELLVVITGVAEMAGFVTQAVVLGGLDEIVQVKNLKAALQSRQLKALKIQWNPTFVDEWTQIMARMKSIRDGMRVKALNLKESAVTRARFGAFRAKEKIKGTNRGTEAPADSARRWNPAAKSSKTLDKAMREAEMRVTVARARKDDLLKELGQIEKAMGDAGTLPAGGLDEVAQTNSKLFEKITKYEMAAKEATEAGVAMKVFERSASDLQKAIDVAARHGKKAVDMKQLDEAYNFLAAEGKKVNRFRAAERVHAQDALKVSEYSEKLAAAQLKQQAAALDGDAAAAAAAAREVSDLTGKVRAAIKKFDQSFAKIEKVATKADETARFTAHIDDPYVKQYLESAHIRAAEMTWSESALATQATYSKVFEIAKSIDNAGDGAKATAKVLDDAAEALGKHMLTADANYGAAVDAIAEKAAKLAKTGMNRIFEAVPTNSAKSVQWFAALVNAQSTTSLAASAKEYRYRVIVNLRTVSAFISRFAEKVRAPTVVLTLESEGVESRPMVVAVRDNPRNPGGTVEALNRRDEFNIHTDILRRIRVFLSVSEGDKVATYLAGSLPLGQLLKDDGTPKQEPILVPVSLYEAEDSGGDASGSDDEDTLLQVSTPGAGASRDAPTVDVEARAGSDGSVVSDDGRDLPQGVPSRSMVSSRDGRKILGHVGLEVRAIPTGALITGESKPPRVSRGAESLEAERRAFVSNAGEKAHGRRIKARGSPLSGPPPTRCPANRAKPGDKDACVHVRIRNFRGGNFPTGGAQMTWMRRITFACRAARAPPDESGAGNDRSPVSGGATDASPGRMCQTSFTSPSCSAPVHVDMDGHHSGDVDVVVSGCADADPRLGVQCEALLPDGSSLGAFRTTLSGAAEPGFITEDVRFHPTLQWPSYMYLFGNQVGTVDVQLECLSETCRKAVGNIRRYRASRLARGGTARAGAEAEASEGYIGNTFGGAPASVSQIDFRRLALETAGLGARAATSIPVAKEWNVGGKKNACPLVFAHRGVASSSAVENTVNAVYESALKGLSGVEVDVFMTGSREYGGFRTSLLHDLNLDRLLAYAQPLGDWNYFTHLRFSKMTGALDSCNLFPGLPEVLRVARALGLRVDVELKPESPMDDPFDGYSDQLSDAVVSDILSLNAQGQCIVSGFDFLKLRKIHSRSEGKVKTAMASFTGALSGAASFVDRVTGLSKSSAHMVSLDLLDKDSLFERLRNNNIMIGLYTMYDMLQAEGSAAFRDETIKVAIDKGVSFIETDDPDRLYAAYKRIGCEMREDPKAVRQARIALVSAPGGGDGDPDDVTEESDGDGDWNRDGDGNEGGQ